MVKYVHGDEELINYTDLVNIFNSKHYDGAKMWNFYKITGHRNLPDNDWGVKVIWDTG